VCVLLQIHLSVQFGANSTNHIKDGTRSTKKIFLHLIRDQIVFEVMTNRGGYVKNAMKESLYIDLIPLLYLIVFQVISDNVYLESHLFVIKRRFIHESQVILERSFGDFGTKRSFLQEEPVSHKYSPPRPSVSQTKSLV